MKFQVDFSVTDPKSGRNISRSSMPVEAESPEAARRMAKDIYFSRHPRYLAEGYKFAVVRVR